MSNFWSLVKFEYKKIIVKKSFIGAVIIMLFVAIVGMISPYFSTGTSRNGHSLSGAKNQKLNKEAQQSVAGYVDDEMIAAVIAKNVEARDNIDEDGDYEWDIYNSNIRPYNTLRDNLIRVLSPVNNSNFENFNSLDNASGIDFYSLRTKLLEDTLKAANCPQKEIDKSLELNATVQTPFYQDYAGGYSTFLIRIKTCTIFFIVCIAMCIAPVFSGEYVQKTDALILTTKYGKSKMIIAKIVAAISFSLIFLLAALLIAAICTLGLYSWTGANVSFQYYDFLSVADITMLQAVIIYCLAVLCVAVVISAITLLCSSRLSPFATIVTVILILFSGMFLNIPMENLRMLNYLFQAKVVLGLVFDQRLADLFGVYMLPYHFIPIICFVGTIIFIPFAYRNFKNHQVK